MTSHHVPHEHNEHASYSLHVSNLDRTTTSKDLLDLFIQISAPHDAYVVMDLEQPERSRGFGIVEYQSEETARRVMRELNRRELKGRPVRIFLASPEERLRSQPPSPNISSSAEASCTMRPPDIVASKPVSAASTTKSVRHQEDIIFPVQEKSEIYPRAATEDYKTFCKSLRKLPLIQMISALESEGVMTLDVSNCCLGCKGCTTVAEFLQHMPALRVLDLSCNGISDEGAKSLAKGLCSVTGLTALRLDSNRFGYSGSADLAHRFSEGHVPAVRELSLADNKLPDRAVKRLLESVSKKFELITLDISKNYLSDGSCEALVPLICNFSKLVELNCSWAHMRGPSTVKFLRSMRFAENLTTLNLAWNGFGDLKPSGAVAECLGDEHCTITDLDLSFNRIYTKAALVIASVLDHNKSLRFLTLDGNPLGFVGCRRLLNVCARSTVGLEEEDSERPSEIILSIRGCSDDTGESSLWFDPTEPAGTYSLDMSDPYAQTVTKDLLKLEAAGKGNFLRAAVMLNGLPFDLPKLQSFEDNVPIPTSGKLDFHFGSLISRSIESQASSQIMQYLSKALQNDNNNPMQDAMINVKSQRRNSIISEGPGDSRSAEKSSAERQSLIETVISGDMTLSLRQAETLMKLLRNSEERISFVVHILHRIIPGEEPSGLFAMLNESERTGAQRLLGPTAYGFTKNNPTGHHRFNLSFKEDRKMLLVLFELKIREYKKEQRIAADYAQRAEKQGVHGALESIDRVWRNAMYKGHKMIWQNFWAVPHEGVIEFDFVQISKPQELDPAARAMTSEEWLAFFESTKRMERVEVVVSFRQLSNSAYFTIAQVRQLLRTFEEDYNDLRVEIVIISYSRTIDFCGFYGFEGLFETALSAPERRMLSDRIGVANMFEPAMAVEYMDFNLAITEHRYVAQQMILLSAIEPGENVVGETFNSMQFSIPVSWLRSIPHSGLFSCSYCREEHIIQEWAEVMERLYPGSFCKAARSPAGTSWALDAKHRRIREKIRLKFESAEACFAALDADGSATLNRRELAVGLFRIGIFLDGQEINALLEALDTDGGGTVDFAKVCVFAWGRMAPL